jgi:hypothetical protein
MGTEGKPGRVPGFSEESGFGPIFSFLEGGIMPEASSE